MALDHRATPSAESSTTSIEQFRHLAQSHRVVPVTRRVLADGFTPLSAYDALAADRPGSFLLESAAHGESWSRWSYIGCGSDTVLTVDNGRTRWLGKTPAGVPEGGDPFDDLAEILDFLHTTPIPGIPPLSSGLVGYFAHDMIRYIEKLPDTCVDDLQIRDMCQIVVTDLAVLDHHEGVMWLIANAINWDNSDDGVDDAYNDAVARLDDLSARLSSAPSPSVQTFTLAEPKIHRQRAAEEHKRRIEICKEHIRAGDAFQIVLSQRFEMDTAATSRDIYRILRTTNPSPYMYLLNIPTDDLSGVDFTIVGSSPESLVGVQDRRVTTHPIAGSRPRGTGYEADVLLAKELSSDEKENSEHLMLVDLGRNDLGKVCTPGTVEVRDFRHIERYSHIMHLVSTVTGELAADKTALDAFKACFPAGTLSGAPKPSALSIIDQLEDSRRGVYGGTVGYFDFSGNTDQAIAIRTGVVRDGKVYVQAGGGIVADSDPELEDQETQNKAAAVLRAVAAAETLSRQDPEKDEHL